MAEEADGGADAAHPVLTPVPAQVPAVEAAPAAAEIPADQAGAAMVAESEGPLLAAPEAQDPAAMDKPAKKAAAAAVEHGRKLDALVRRTLLPTASAAAHLGTIG